MSDTKISEAAVAWRQRHPKEGGGLSEWIYTAREPKKYVGSEYEALYLHPQPAELAGQQGVDPTVTRAVNSKDLYQVLMDVQNGIDSPALASMANGAVQLIDKARNALAATGKQQVGEVHPDDVAVDAFAAAMKLKMADARAKGRGGWEDPAQCSAVDLTRLLRAHVEKGDPRDVANFCMMLWNRQEGIAPQVEEVQGARAQFEAWQETFYTYPLDTTRHSDGHYQNPVTQGAFAIWKAALASRQPVGHVPYGFVLTWTHGETNFTRQAGVAAEHQDYKNCTVVPVYAAPPAQGIDLGHGKFRDPDHLAEWLGSLVDGNEQEEWDAAQAAMQGVRAYQRDADTVLRLQAAVEGECDGLAITPEQAVAILDYVLQPLNYDDSQRDAAPGVGNG